MTPLVAAQLIKAGHEVIIEDGAGLASAFQNSTYTDAGCSLASNASEAASQGDLVVQINPPDDAVISLLRPGQVWMSMLFHLSQPDLMAKLNEKGVSAFSLDAIPRISKAQSMDVLSSQSNLAGYKAILLGANHMTRIFPLMMTAAGTITPSKVLIFGVGVAGLQAIATAKRLGAVVEATDVRPETKEQAESLGAKFLEVKMEGGVKAEGGYAREVSEEYAQKQKEVVNNSLRQADLVITTALIPGKKAPLLISEEQLAMMKYGSVIVDMGVEQGGNCAGSKVGEIVTTANGVKILGFGNLPSQLATNASELFAKNVSTFFNYLATKDGFKWELDEEITNGTLICHQGKLLKQ